MPRLVLISDTHCLHDGLDIPDGDILVHAGDLTNRGTVSEVADFSTWLKGLPHKTKIVIAGNHDFCFENAANVCRDILGPIIYLQDESVQIDGLKFYGSPWQPTFFNWAFNLDRGEQIAQKWALIPEDTEILITHGPPFGILDRTREGLAVGCEDLLERLSVINPKLHVFGHIHEGYGVSERRGTIFVNASIRNRNCNPINPPIVIDL